MKRSFSLLLVLLLSLCTALPAAAAEAGSNKELERVTQSVKETLDLETDSYSVFHGDYEEGVLTPLWNLYWDGDTGSLSVSALPDGTIVNYTLSLSEPVSRPSSGLPSFPQGNPQQARSAAETFLNQVLGTEESAILEAPTGLDRLDSTTYRFSGTIFLQGLPSPLSCSITVRATDNLVTYFRRDVPENTFLGSIPTTSAQVPQSDAATALRTTQSLRLEYVLPNEDSTHAVLCYLPDPAHTFYVDAKTGKLVDLTEQEQLMGQLGMGGASDSTDEENESTSADKNLSQAEQAGIQQLDGVKSQNELDKALRAIPEYGLASYTLSSARFSVGEAAENGQAPVTCMLYYSRVNGEDVLTRTFTVDARTGQVCSLYSYIPWDEEVQGIITQAAAQIKAETFLKSYYEEHAAHLALYDSPSITAVPSENSPDVSAYTFCFARKESGYFFPDQNYTVRIDATDGSVCGFSFQYDEAITFDSPHGIISAQTAMDVWMDTYNVTLGYLLVPQVLEGTDSASQRLSQTGLSAYYYLELGYTLERTNDYRGIDAKSGQPISYSRQDEEPGISYSDVGEHWAQKELLQLSRFGVGYAGGTFQPEKTLTQWDLICLLYSLNSAPLDPAKATEHERNTAYAAAYSIGVLTRAERNDNETLTRSQLIQCLLDAAGYGTVAQLKGIFTCTYPDRDSIPTDELGYAALAQGLGLVSGTYHGAIPATRSQAAVMLYRLMDRSVSS